MRIFTKLLLAATAVMFLSAAPAAAETGGKSRLAVVVYPSAIYDSEKCSIYRNHLSKLMFMFFYRGKSRLDDFGASSRLHVELPANLKLNCVGIMDGWKTDGGVFTQFPNEKIRRDGQPYISYTVPLPKIVNRHALEKPLPGGMFGGTCHNMANLYVKPSGALPDKFKIYWRITGKYPASGSFPAYLRELSAKTKNPRRIKLRSFGPEATMGNPAEYVRDLSKIYQKIGIKWVDTQLAEGKNRGYKDIWSKGGFNFYGGGGFLHTLMQYSMAQRTASSNMNDYLVGLDGKRAYATRFQAYHGRIWCPTAVITPGRYPWKLNIAVAKREAGQGATELDADFEIHGWSHCFCPDCLKTFAEFAKIPYANLKSMKPVDIVKTYPVQWYKFRSWQTGQLYTMLRKYLHKNYPGVKIGCNTILNKAQNDLGKLKYGICDFAEDPRLLKDSVDYFLADTLTGSVYDPIAVDIIRKTTGKPVISVAGCSYCVGFSPHCMAFRHLTAKLTGGKYGYERRADFLKLGMVHQAASGAVGIRFTVEEAEAAIKADEAAAILAQVEDWYLDGKRADEKVEVIDITQAPSPWLKDNSRVGGNIWRSFYNMYSGRVQFRVHLKNNTVMVSLFNWDPHQRKKWLVRLPGDLAKNCYVTDVAGNQTVCLDGKKLWAAAELRRGLPVDVPAAGMTILKFTPNAVNTAGQLDITAKVRNNALKLAKNQQPYNQYSWHKGGQFDMKQVIARALKRPLYQLKKYGGRQKIQNLSGNVSIPFTSDFSKPQRGLLAWSGKKDVGKNKVLSSEKKYCFAGVDLKPENRQLTLKIVFKCIAEARFGAMSYEKAKTLKKISTLCWGKTAKEFQELSFTLPVDKYKNRNCRILFYNAAHKGAVLIKKIELTEAKNDRN